MNSQLKNYDKTQRTKPNRPVRVDSFGWTIIGSIFLFNKFKVLVKQHYNIDIMHFSLNVVTLLSDRIIENVHRFLIGGQGMADRELSASED